MKETWYVSDSRGMGTLENLSAKKLKIITADLMQFVNIEEL